MYIFSAWTQRAKGAVTAPRTVQYINTSETRKYDHAAGLWIRIRIHFPPRRGKLQQQKTTKNDTKLVIIVILYKL